MLVDDQSPLVLRGNGKDGVAAGWNILAFDTQVCCRHKGRGLIGAGAPDFAVGNQFAENLAAFGARAGIVHGNGLAIRELALRLRRRTGPLVLVLLRGYDETKGKDK